MTKFPFSEQLGIRETDRRAKGWSGAAAVTTVQVQSDPHSVTELFRIRYRQQLDVFKGLACQNAQRGAFADVGQTVKWLRNENPIQVDAGVLEGLAHHGELSVEVVISRGGNSGQSLNRAERIVG